MKDKEGTFCLAEQQPKAFPEGEAGFTGDPVGAEPAGPAKPGFPLLC